MDESSGPGSGSVTGPGELGTGYAEWRCTQCGHGHPKNNPPCDRCGNMRFERVVVSAAEFDRELQGAGYLEILRENLLLVVVAAIVLLVAGGAILTSSGVFVLRDPFGLGYRYGTVGAVSPNGDGTLTAGEFRATVAADYDVRSVSWSGRQLELTYETRADSGDALREELGDVSVRYADYVSQGGDAARLRITATSGRSTVARVTVERPLAERFADGELSRDAYVSRVLSGDSG